MERGSCAEAYPWRLVCEWFLGNSLTAGSTQRNVFLSSLTLSMLLEDLLNCVRFLLVPRKTWNSVLFPTIGVAPWSV